MTDNNSDGSRNAAAQLFGILELDDLVACNLFEAFEALSHDDVKEWLPKGMPMNQILWRHGINTEHGKEFQRNNKGGRIIPKLMYCWAKKAHDRGAITYEQLTVIDKKLPNIDVELESPSLTAIAPNAASVATTHPAATMSVYEGTLTVTREEEDAVAVGIPDTGYTPIDVKCPEAVFYAKTFNIENQLGGCFTRIQEIYKIYAKESKAMIEEAGMKESFFGANW